MPTIKALTNVGSKHFRLLRKDKEIELTDDQMDEGIKRLFDNGSIEIDGKRSPRAPAVEQPVTDVPEIKDPVKKETETGMVEDQDAETPQEDPQEPPKDEEPIKSDSEEVVEDGQEETPEPAKGPQTAPSEDANDDTSDPDASDEVAPEHKEFVNSQAAGYFSEVALAALEVPELKEIGDKVGADVKRKKSGIDNIIKRVERVVANG